MNRESTIRTGLVLGVILSVGGLVIVIWPQSGIIAHFTNDVMGLSAHYQMEYASPSAARLYGTLAVLLGVGIVLFAVYRDRS